MMLGKRLLLMNITFEKCVYSTLKRAAETAQILLKHIHPNQIFADSLLKEGHPIPPDPPMDNLKQVLFFMQFILLD